MPGSTDPHFSCIISTSGVQFQTSPIPVVLPANSFHVLRLAGIATEAGTLVIRGCFVEGLGCDRREFTLPASTEQEESERDKRQSRKEGERERMKWTGLERRGIRQLPGTTAAREQEQAEQKFLECRVIPEQPLLRIRRTSLTHGAVMLYDGES